MIDLTQLTCSECSGVFAVGKYWFSCIKERGGEWYCPYCGFHWSYGETENDKLRRARDRLQQRIAQKDDELASLERSRNAIKGAMTKMKKRTAAGVCPCCKRTFKQLAAHMAQQHPEYDDTEVA